MNVWYVSAYDQPKGQSPRTWDFCVELLRRGHTVTMFTNSFCHFTRHERLTPGEKWRVELIDGVRVVWLKSIRYEGNGIGRGLNMLQNAWGVLRSARLLQDKPDVVLGPSVPLFAGWAAERLATRFRVPFIFEVRDVWPDALVDIGGLTRANPIYTVFRIVEKRLYKKAARISSTVPHLGDHVAKSGSDPNKIVVMPNGIDLSAFDEVGPYNGGSSEHVLVMYVGGFGLDHDVPTIIEAAKILQDSGDCRFRFVLIGGGVRKAHCEALARRYQLRNLVLREPVPKTSLPEVQRDADILVAAITDSPSYRFGLNLNKLCTYFASGRPVLFAGNPPNNPVLESGSGVSVEAENPSALVAGLREIADAPRADRIRMAAAGREYARNTLGIEVLGTRMEAMLATVVNEAARSCN
jgi:glycosyltransferase involved in cell wall biosynthesis